MAILFGDQFYFLSPTLTSGDTLTSQQLVLEDNNADGFISRNGGDLLNNVAIVRVYVNQVLTLDVNGTTTVITGTRIELSTGEVYFTPTDGQRLPDDATFVSSSFTNMQGTVANSAFAPPCFTPGTLIRVPGGVAAVEKLKAGDLVETMDHGPQVLRWVGQRQVAATGDLAPVSIAAGALGNDRDLRVSPEHRMLVTGWLAELHFGEEDVLVAAKHLVGLPGIVRQEQARVTYLHLLFDRHEIVFAEGAASESLHPSSWLIERDSALRAEIAAVFPGILDRLGGPPVPSARRVVTRREARLIAA